MAGEAGQRGTWRAGPTASGPAALPTWGLALPTQTPRTLSPCGPQGCRASHWGLSGSRRWLGDRTSTFSIRERADITALPPRG